MIGLVGSMHCVGMCGPIALALPYQSTNRWLAGFRVLVYNFGRVITYAMLGVLIGFFGKAIFMAGMQIYISIGLGILLLIAALFSINIESRLLRVSYFGRLNVWVKKSMGRLFKSQKTSSLLSLGMLNGLLPCGLVYMAIAGAVGTGSVWQGAAYMALFGLGTIPLMFATAVAGQFINLNWRLRIQKLVPVFLVFFALLFIARGLNFNVPHEIRFWEYMQDTPMCH